MTFLTTCTETVRLLGTQLSIAQGEKAVLYPATGIPGGGWFAQLATEDDAWGDDSIHLSDEDAAYHFSGPWHICV